MFYTDDDIKRIKDVASGKIVEVITDFLPLVKSGINFVCDCPKCGTRKKFTVSPAKQIFGCFSCKDLKGSDAITYLMKVEGKDYVETLDYLVRKFNVILDQRPEPKKTTVPIKMKKSSKASKGQDITSYCARMLAQSGLTFEDVTAKVFKTGDHKSIFEARTFRQGTIDDKGNIVSSGDDVIIEYYNLEGIPITYEKRDGRDRLTGKHAEYFRVRWQHPEAHLNKEGKPYKYKSPYKGGSPIYIPERLRQMYQTGTPIHRLYIQEGEKKAEKACKHGIPSIAISGIQNIANKEKGTLPEEMVSIITRCQVKEVALLFDADWQDLSSNIRINDQIAQRPYCFYAAARNYKEYMVMLKNREIYVDIFIGHVRENESGDKGLDDLLANTLQGKEDELAVDIEFAVNDKKHQGKHIEMFKISDWSDNKLKELWSLQSPQNFAEKHKKTLQNLPEFLFGRYRWKFDENGALVLAQPFDDDEKFWIEETKVNTKGDSKEVCTYDYVNAKNFFQNRGIGRYRLLDGTWNFIHLAPPIVRTIGVEDARDFMYSFAEHNCSKNVNQMLLQGGSQYVGPFQMSRLAFIEPNFIQPTRDTQMFYFDKLCWSITKNKVEEVGYESITHHIWAEQRKETPAKYLGKPLISFTEKNGTYNYTITPEGQECHFLQFLVNTSNFTWRKSPEEVEESEANENNIQLLSKLCAIGFMSMEYKDANVSRAVVGMDGKQSEVGESNGRSGKSLIGELMRQIVPLAYIPGKRRDLLDDQFLWNDVVDNTKIAFIDDVLQGFNFEMLFPNITGDWTVNYKGGRRLTYPFANSPKIYISTNHALRGSGGSYNDRQWLLAFSDFYNDTHKPVDDFGYRFFVEWDYTQWNLCWNLIATCVQIYMQFGVIQAPGERLEQRKLRQEIGETFISWAEEYFSLTTRINTRLIRKTLYDDFLNYDPNQRKYITATEFKKRLIKFCEWKHYVFNPQKYDSITGQPFQVDKDGRPVLDDKSGGTEYFTIGADFTSAQETSFPQEEGSQLPFQPGTSLEY